MRASDYPLPDYAVSVWHRGDALAIGLPSLGADESAGRTLFIPLDKLPLEAPGWRAFITLLAERRHTYQANERPLLSTPAEPTARQLEEMCKAHYAQKKRDVSIEEEIFTETTTQKEETGNA